VGRPRHGFTLLEVMVAVTVLGIAMTAILYGQAQGIRAQARIQDVTLATIKAKELLVHYLGAGRSEIPRSGDSLEITLDPPFDYLKGTLLAEEDPAYPGVLVLTLTVSWPGPRQDREDTFSTTTGQGGGKSLQACFYVANLQ